MKKEKKDPAQDAVPHYRGHRDRLRKRFVSSGDSMENYELLELLLFHSIPRRDVKELSKKILDHFGSLSKLMSASYDQLLAVRGISANSAVLILLVREMMARYYGDTALEGDVLSEPGLVAKFARAKLAHLGHEVLMAIFVNAKNRVCGFETISEGTTDYAVVYPKKIVRRAIERNACGIIISHNHPSGDCDPSQDDISLTRKTHDAAKLVDLRLLDHVIVGKSGYFSFVEKGISF